jgi:hypothetical protein
MYSTIVPYVNLSGGCGYFIFLIDTKISKFCHGISPTVHRFHQLLFSEIFKNIQMFCSFLFIAMHSPGCSDDKMSVEIAKSTPPPPFFDLFCLYDK